MGYRWDIDKITEISRRYHGDIPIFNVYINYMISMGYRWDIDGISINITEISQRYFIL